MGKDENNFARGSIPRHIINLAGPMIVAQLINVLYNVIDRIYIGRIPDVATLAMGRTRAMFATDFYYYCFC